MVGTRKRARPASPSRDALPATAPPASGPVSAQTAPAPALAPASSSLFAVVGGRAWASYAGGERRARRVLAALGARVLPPGPPLWWTPDVDEVVAPAQARSLLWVCAAAAGRQVPLTPDYVDACERAGALLPPEEAAKFRWDTVTKEDGGSVGLGSRRLWIGAFAFWRRVGPPLTGHVVWIIGELRPRSPAGQAVVSSAMIQIMLEAAGAEVRSLSLSCAGQNLESLLRADHRPPTFALVPANAGGPKQQPLIQFCLTRHILCLGAAFVADLIARGHADVVEYVVIPSQRNLAGPIITTDTVDKLHRGEAVLVARQSPQIVPPLSSPCTAEFRPTSAEHQLQGENGDKSHSSEPCEASATQCRSPPAQKRENNDCFEMEMRSDLTEKTHVLPVQKLDSNHHTANRHYSHPKTLMTSTKKRSCPLLPQRRRRPPIIAESPPSDDDDCKYMKDDAPSPIDVDNGKENDCSSWSSRDDCMLQQPLQTQGRQSSCRGERELRAVSPTDPVISSQDGDNMVQQERLHDALSTKTGSCEPTGAITELRTGSIVATSSQFVMPDTKTTSAAALDPVNDACNWSTTMLRNRKVRCVASQHDVDSMTAVDVADTCDLVLQALGGLPDPDAVNRLRASDRRKSGVLSQEPENDSQADSSHCPTHADSCELSVTRTPVDYFRTGSKRVGATKRLRSIRGSAGTPQLEQRNRGSASQINKHRLKLTFEPPREIRQLPRLSPVSSFDPSYVGCRANGNTIDDAFCEGELNELVWFFVGDRVEGVHGLAKRLEDVAVRDSFGRLAAKLLLDSGVLQRTLAYGGVEIRGDDILSVCRICSRLLALLPPDDVVSSFVYALMDIRDEQIRREGMDSLFLLGTSKVLPPVILRHHAFAALCTEVVKHCNSNDSLPSFWAMFNACAISRFRVDETVGVDSDSRLPNRSSTYVGLQSGSQSAGFMDESKSEKSLVFAEWCIEAVIGFGALYSVDLVDCRGNAIDTTVPPEPRDVQLRSGVYEELAETSGFYGSLTASRAVSCRNPNWKLFEYLLERIAAISCKPTEKLTEISRSAAEQPCLLLTEILRAVAIDLAENLWVLQESFVIAVVEFALHHHGAGCSTCSSKSLPIFLSHLRVSSFSRRRSTALDSELKTFCDCVLYVVWLFFRRCSESSRKTAGKIVRLAGNFCKSDFALQDQARALRYCSALTLAVADSISNLARSGGEELLRGLLFAKAPDLSRAFDDPKAFGTREKSCWDVVLEVILFRSRNLISADKSCAAYVDYAKSTFSQLSNYLSLSDDRFGLDCDLREAARVQGRLLFSVTIGVIETVSEIVASHDARMLAAVGLDDHGRVERAAACGSSVVKSLVALVDVSGAFLRGLVSQMRTDAASGVPNPCGTYAGSESPHVKPSQMQHSRNQLCLAISRFFHRTFLLAASCFKCSQRLRTMRCSVNLPNSGSAPDQRQEYPTHAGNAERDGGKLPTFKDNTPLSNSLKVSGGQRRRVDDGRKFAIDDVCSAVSTLLNHFQQSCLSSTIDLLRHGSMLQHLGQDEHEIRELSVLTLARSMGLWSVLCFADGSTRPTVQYVNIAQAISIAGLGFDVATGPVSCPQLARPHNRKLLKENHLDRTTVEPSSLLLSPSGRVLVAEFWSNLGDCAWASTVFASDSSAEATTIMSWLVLLCAPESVDHPEHVLKLAFSIGLWRGSRPYFANFIRATGLDVRLLQGPTVSSHDLAKARPEIVAQGLEFLLRKTDIGRDEQRVFLKVLHQITFQGAGGKLYQHSGELIRNDGASALRQELDLVRTFFPVYVVAAVFALFAAQLSIPDDQSDSATVKSAGVYFQRRGDRRQDLKDQTMRILDDALVLLNNVCSFSLWDQSLADRGARQMLGSIASHFMFGMGCLGYDLRDIELRVKFLRCVTLLSPLCFEELVCPLERSNAFKWLLQWGAATQGNAPLQAIRSRGNCCEEWRVMVIHSQIQDPLTCSAFGTEKFCSATGKLLSLLTMHAQTGSPIVDVARDIRPSLTRMLSKVTFKTPSTPDHSKASKMPAHSFAENSRWMRITLDHCQQIASTLQGTWDEEFPGDETSLAKALANTAVDVVAGVSAAIATG